MPYEPTPEDLAAAGLKFYRKEPAFLVMHDGDETGATATRKLSYWWDGKFHAARRDPAQKDREFWFWTWGEPVDDYPSLAWLLNWFKGVDLDGFLYACGDVVCPECGQPYKRHPLDRSVPGDPWLNILCDGTAVKL